MKTGSPCFESFLRYRFVSMTPYWGAMIMNLTEGCNFAILKGLTVEKKVVFSYLKMILKGEEQWN